MLKEKVAIPKNTSRTAEPAVRQVIILLGGVVLGLLVPRVTVYGGLSPFGVGLAAACGGPGSLLVYIATAVGYLLSGTAMFPIRYIAAVAVVAGIRWSFSGIKLFTRNRITTPLCAFLATAAAGLAVQFAAGLDGYGVLATLCEGLLAGGFAWFCAVTAEVLRDAEGDRCLTAQEQAAIVVTGAVGLISLAGIEFGGISPGRVAVALVILLLARSGKEQGGSIAGIALGVMLAMTDPTHAYLAIAYALGGLLAGMFARLGRLASAGAFVAANTVVIMSSGADNAVITGVYETAAAAILFSLLPAALDRPINRLFARGQELPAMEGLRRSVVARLKFAASAMHEVAGTVDAVSTRLAKISAPELGAVYRSVAEDICHDCGRCMQCWEADYSDTMSSFNDMTAVLREQGSIQSAQVTGSLARCCGHLDAVLRRVNHGYREHLVREGAFRRLSEIRGVANDQFACTASMLDELAITFDAAEQVDEEAAARVQTICADCGWEVREITCVIGRNGRMTVELIAADTARRFDEDDWRRQIGDACGRVFAPPVAQPFGGDVRVLLRERPLFSVAVGTAQLSCSGERLCGDAVEVFADADGRQTAVLSDGMGSGGRAAVDGAMAAGLTARLMQAGFRQDSVLRMVNSALMVKSGDESLATLDIAAVDLYNGRLECLKAGAAVSLLRSGGRVSRIERSSLPVGILRDIHFERSTDTLSDGDVLLLVSDGVVSDGSAWLEELLLGFDPATATMQGLAEQVVAAARRRQADSHEDDVTAVAMYVKRLPR